MNNLHYSFKDFFWLSKNKLEFDIKNTEAWNGSCIHYLHGALHLVETCQGITKKLRATENTLLLNRLDYDIGQFPLFITEGFSNHKLSKIKNNEYLNFCYSKLQYCKDNLLIFGHSLNEEYDDHILDAIEHFPRIAISVFPEQDTDKINIFMDRLRSRLKNSVLTFFDSTSHPLNNIQIPQNFSIPWHLRNV